MNRVEHPYNFAVTQELNSLIRDTKLQNLYPSSITNKDNHLNSVIARLREISQSRSSFAESLSSFTRIIEDFGDKKPFVNSKNQLHQADNPEERQNAVERIGKKLLNSKPVIDFIGHIRELSEALLGQKPFSEICPEI